MNLTITFQQASDNFLHKEAPKHQMESVVCHSL